MALTRDWFCMLQCKFSAHCRCESGWELGGIVQQLLHLLGELQASLAVEFHWYGGSLGSEKISPFEALMVFEGNHKLLVVGRTLLSKEMLLAILFNWLQFWSRSLWWLSYDCLSQVVMVLSGFLIQTLMWLAILSMWCITFWVWRRMGVLRTGNLWMKDDDESSNS